MGLVSSKLTSEERKVLRKIGVKKKDLPDLTPGELTKMTAFSPERCEQLVGLTQLEGLTSVGPSIAKDLWILGYRSVESLRIAKPEAMYDRLCELAGHRVDPCVEDVFRCAVAQARHDDLSSEARNWWYWTPYRRTGRVDA